MTRLIVITGFIVAFLAGLMAGVAWKGNPVVTSPGDSLRPNDRNNERGSWIAQQLSLTPEQQKQMREIWSEVTRRGGREMRERRAQIRREQEEAIARLVRDEDKAAYQKIIEDARTRTEALEAEGKKAFEQAVAKTKAILNADQLKKYEAILARPPERGPDRGTERGPERGPDRGDRPPPATRPQ